MNIAAIGVDLAKNVFALRGVDGRGNRVSRKSLRREQVVPFFTRLEPCVVVMEACGSAHFWTRKLQSLGHTVRVLFRTLRKPEHSHTWLAQLASRRNSNVACVAQANKTARIVWAMLAHNSASTVQQGL